MEIGDTFQLNASNYSTQFERLQDGLISFERDHNWPEASNQIDVFSNSWSFSFADLKPGQLGIQRHGKRQEFTGPWMVLLPPFSIVNFRIGKGLFSWRGYISNEPLDASLPQEPVGMKWNGYTPRSVNEIKALVESCREKTPVSAEEKPSAVAAKTLAEINATFSSDIKIAEIADKLKFHHAIMTRAFRRAYGLSPVEYRNKLRTWEALSLILFNQKPITRASMDVGFKSIGRFNKNFRKNTGTVPSGFVPKKHRVKEQ